MALFGYLALLYTITLQREELALSREELTLTRGELERSASALEAQAMHLDKQSASQAFFDLFQMYKSVVSELEYGAKDNKSHGKAVLEHFRNRFIPWTFYDDSPWDLEKVRSTHQECNEELGSYFRIIYRILMFLEETGKDGKFFADMFRAQLTTSELHLLFLNCVSDVGKPMQRYAAVFELFDNMPLPTGRDFSVIAEQLDPAAFGHNSALAKLVESSGIN